MTFSRTITYGMMPLLLGTALLLGGCQLDGIIPHRQPTAEAPKPAEPPRASSTDFHGLITGLFAESGDEKSKLVIRGDHKLSFTSYRMNKPDRLAIEIRGVKNGMRRKNIPINDSILGTVHLISFKRVNAVRVEIGIKMPYLYDIFMSFPTR